MEMAAAAGLPLLTKEERNPLYTTTRGVGEMILDALDSGCRSFIIGIGGSATNDGGSGMLKALGFGLFDSEGKEIPDGAIGLSRLAKIDASGALPELSECEITVACDVENPLCGELGCSAVYAPQKGAAPEDIEKMDGWLARYAELARDVSAEADPNFPGAGAAGGLGFALKAFLGARLTPGAELVIKETGLSLAIAEADIVVTGEGRLDFQTSMGKAPIGVAREAKKHGKTVIAFSGCIGKGAGACNENGIDAFFPITRSPMTLEEAMDNDNAYENLRATAEQAFRLYKSAKAN
jgi:glycerate kinase